MEVIVPAVTVKVVEDCPPVTAAVVGTVNPAELLFVRPTLMPAAGAGPFSVIVQVEFPELNVLGEQDSETIEGRAPPVTVPPVALNVMLDARGDDATAFERLKDVELTPTAIVRFTTATVPFEMIPWFRPETTQL